MPGRPGCAEAHARPSRGQQGLDHRTRRAGRVYRGVVGPRTYDGLFVEGASSAVAHRAHRVDVLGGVHRFEQLTGGWWRLPDLVAEPSAPGERRLDRSDARGPLGMPAGRLVLQASGMREIQRTSHHAELAGTVTGTTFGLALIPSATTRSLIAHATWQREPAVTVPVSSMPACQKIGHCSVRRRQVMCAECGRPSAELAHAA